jgi:hypothetical protein
MKENKPREKKKPRYEKPEFIDLSLSGRPGTAQGNCGAGSGDAGHCISNGNSAALNCGDGNSAGLWCSGGSNPKPGESGAGSGV